jgi:hypothetical protein
MLYFIKIVAANIAVCCSELDANGIIDSETLKFKTLSIFDRENPFGGKPIENGGIEFHVKFAETLVPASLPPAAFDGADAETRRIFGGWQHKK